MRYFMLCILVLSISGCGQVVKYPPWPDKNIALQPSTLYGFRLEHSDTTKFSGVLALKPQEQGMLAVLLDATGVPLVKSLVLIDGTMQAEYVAAAVQGSKLPELLGKIIKYIYFTPADTDCPWYDFSCVLQETGEDEQWTRKWEKFGPITLWRIKRQARQPVDEKITVHLNLSAISVHLQQIDNRTKK